MIKCIVYFQSKNPSRDVISSTITTHFDWLSYKQNRKYLQNHFVSSEIQKKIDWRCLTKIELDLKENEIRRTSNFTQHERKSNSPLIFPQFLASNRITISNAVLWKNYQLLNPSSPTIILQPLRIFGTNERSERKNSKKMSRGKR